MTAAEVAALGGPAAGGIPVTVIPTLRLWSPNGGERFPAGSTQTITWTATNPTGSVELDLYQGTNFYRVLARPPMQQSSYAWTIYARLGDSEDYRIQIRSVTFPTVNDFSDSPFAIQGSGSTPNPLFGQPAPTQRRVRIDAGELANGRRSSHGAGPGRRAWVAQ